MNCAEEMDALTIVIPCFNEESTMRLLRERLGSIVTDLRRTRDVELLFVDDGSTDGTCHAIERAFETWSRWRIVRHERNRGIAAAIQTGLQHANSEVVCSIDADCTYDPRQVSKMLPRLETGIDLVVASPYHRAGKTIGVPRHRLWLSFGLSALYRMVLDHKLATYTSCFRVYRRRSVVGIQLRHPGFVGIVELLAAIEDRGGRIVEHPAALHVRLTGYSKMRLNHVGRGHILMLATLTMGRLKRLFRGRDRTHAHPGAA